MIQQYFLELDREDSKPFSILESAQIEPAAPDDPDELYRMRYSNPHGRRVDFDVVFYPNYAEIQDPDMNVRVSKIDEGASEEEFRSTLKFAIGRLS